MIGEGQMEGGRGEEGICNDNDLKLSICQYRGGMVAHQTRAFVSHRPRMRFLKNQHLQP